jgi:hypothetical protein
MSQKKYLDLLPLIGMIVLLVGCNLPAEEATPRPGSSVTTITTMRGFQTFISTETATPLPPTTIPVPTRDPTITGIWGHLANPGFENESIKTTLFFAGQARDGSDPYGCSPDANLQLFTVHPEDGQQLSWSASQENRTLVLDQMADAGLNVVSMSTWGEDFLPCSVGWSQIAPMQIAPQAQDELFSAASGEHLVIMPFIESRNDWAFTDEFPRTINGQIAPGTVSQVTNLIDRYLLNPDHPEWAQQWAQVYNRNHEPRYAIVIIHASSNRLVPGGDAAFAAGFDLLAGEIYQTTGINVGFFIDPLPRGTNAPGTFRPSPETTGPALSNTDALLGIQSFIPEVWVSGSPNEARLIAWKYDYSRRWSNTGIPFLIDVSPGYDASIVFPASIRYGFDQHWQDELTSMVTKYGQDGLVFNSWNGYTEGMVAVPTREYSDRFYRWLESLCTLVDAQK